MNFLDKLYSLEIGTFMFQFLMNQVSGLSIFSWVMKTGLSLLSEISR